MSNTNKLAKELGKVLGDDFEKNLSEILNEEIADKNYFPHEDFANEAKPCEARAKAIIAEALKRSLPDTESIMKGCIATHRSESHDEDTVVELGEVLETLSVERQSLAVAPYWGGELQA